MLLQVAKYYDHAFDERFILITKPSDTTTVKMFLECAPGVDRVQHLAPRCPQGSMHYDASASL